MSEINWKIRPFRMSDAPSFAALNRRWIEEMFSLEEKDAIQLEHPKNAILDKGGFISVADASGWVVGTGGILPAAFAPDDGRKWMEVIKMATDPAAQGQGIGAAILESLLDFARQEGADAIWLETNQSLEAATALYAKYGFKPLSEDEAWETPYERCNLQMARSL